MLHSKIFNKFLIFFSKRWIFKKNEEVDILLLDNGGANLFFESCSFNYLKNDEINFRYFFTTLIKFIFFEKNKSSNSLGDIYFKTIVNSFNPKITIGNEVDHTLFRFKKLFPKKKSIIYQFATYVDIYKIGARNRHLGFFKNKLSRINFDYFFIYNDWCKKFFSSCRVWVPSLSFVVCFAEENGTINRCRR